MALTPDQQRRMRVRRMNLLMAYASFASSKAVAWTPAELFAQGEQGVWYDPSDMTTLFQDAAGTTPVTAVEQPVGLMLDKSQGLVLGSELETDTWSTPPSGVTYSDGTFTFDGVTSQLNVVFSTNTPATSIVAGKTYLVSFTIFQNTTLSVGVDVGGALGDAQTAPGTYTRYIVATNSTGPQVRFRNATGPRTGSMGNISVRELPGNHATQSTSASRPVLSARVNLLTYTEEFDNAAWVKSAVSITANAAVAPDGTTTADTLIENNISGTHYLQQNVSPGTGSLVYSIYAKLASGTRYLQVRPGGLGSGKAYANFDLSTGVVVPSGSGGTEFVSASVTATSNGYYRCELVANHAVSPTSILVMLSSSTGEFPNYTGDGTSGIYIWGADLRVTNAGANLPAYQRVGAATAGTSTTAGNADYDTTGFPMYLKFDGTDDSMATGTINPGAVDKAQVFAGVRKLSDAAQGVLAEWSATIASNNGTFLLAAPDGATATFGFDSKGTTQVDAVASGQTAPLTAVLSGLADISGDIATIRVNGAQADQDTGDQGTGNYLSYPLYIGRRGGTTLPFSGQLYSLIARFSATNLPDATIAQTETWVSGKTGLSVTPTFPAPNNLIWATGNNLIWDTGNNITWG